MTCFLIPSTSCLTESSTGVSLGAFRVRVTPGRRSSIVLDGLVTSMPSMEITASPACDSAFVGT